MQVIKLYYSTWLCRRQLSQTEAGLCPSTPFIQTGNMIYYDSQRPHVTVTDRNTDVSKNLSGLGEYLGVPFEKTWSVGCRSQDFMNSITMATGHNYHHRAFRRSHDCNSMSVFSCPNQSAPHCLLTCEISNMLKWRLQLITPVTLGWEAFRHLNQMAKA